MVWHQDQVPNPQLPPPPNYGWTKGDCLLVITTLIPLARHTSHNYLVKCGCKQSKCCSKCSCRSQQLKCSEICHCGAHKDVCENVSHDQTLGSMIKRRRIHHSKRCEITTCTCWAANIVLCKNSDNVNNYIYSLYFASHFVDTERLWIVSSERRYINNHIT